MDLDTSSFNNLGLCDQLCDICTKMGWKIPTKIQRETIPLALSGKDIIGLAETGSGKTGAFALPIIQNLMKTPQTMFALILTPTRELAFQISEQFTTLGCSIGLKSVVIVGGVDSVSQALALAKKPHIIIATPGRLVDHLENTKGFSLRYLKFLVLDEADKILNMDFEEEVDKILKVLPKQRNTYLFSATMTKKVEKLQRVSLVDPVKIEVSQKYMTVDGLLQYYIFIPQKYKNCYLVGILNELSGNTSIIFCSTCNNVQKLTLMLRLLGYDSIPLHGQMDQDRRLGALNRFKSRENSMLIATDVAARGLDITHVDLVINYDIPANPKDYVHRVGRTARAGRSGKSITIITQYDIELFQKIEHLIDKKLPLFEMPSEEEVLQCLDRITEAERNACLELRKITETTPNSKKSKINSTDSMADDEVSKFFNNKVGKKRLIKKNKR